MGSGYRSFSSGEVLTAANVNGYLMKQSLMSFATTAARDAAITAPEEGMVAVITGSDLMTVYTGSAWVEYGRYGRWENWTPIVTATTTDPSFGSGGFYTVSGRYTRIGSLVMGQAIMIAGNTGVSAGSGTYLLNLPVTPYSTSVQVGTGQATVTGANATGMLRIGNGITQCWLVVNGTSWTSSNPIVNGTQVRWHFMYEAA